MHDGPGPITVELEYRLSRYGAGAMAELVERYRAFLEEVVAEPGRPLSELLPEQA